MIVTWLAIACSDAAPPAMAPVPVPAAGQQVAVFAGGCFWCMESDFDKLPGVVSTTSGFAGGSLADPTYEKVGAHGTGHLEVVQVVFDPKVVPYEGLLDYFWRHVDPTDAGGQFCDRGETYQTAIFPIDDAQKKAAGASKAAIDAAGWLGKPIVTPIRSGEKFWPAEVYHQDFHVTTPGRYVPYRKGCGRDAKVAQVWAKAPATAAPATAGH